MDARMYYRALAAVLVAGPGFAELRGGITQVDFSSFPEFSAYVMVEDEEGHFVQGVTPADVSVQEDAVPISVSRVVSVAAVEGQPSSAMSIVLGIDNSASMLGREKQFEQAPVATSNSPTRGRVKLPHLKTAGTG
jgi:hypothetical protein